MSDQGNGRKPGGFGKGARPVGRPAGARGTGRPARAPSGENRTTGTARPVRTPSDGNRGPGAARPASGDRPRSFARHDEKNMPRTPGQRYGRPAGEQPTNDRPAGERPAGERPMGDKRTFGRPASGRPAFGKSTGGRPAFGKPAFRRPAGGRPASGRPTSGRPATSRPVPAEPTSGLSMNARRLALDVLQDVHKGGAYASLALQDRLSRSQLNPADKRLATNIVYGTLENQLRLDFALNRLMEHAPNEPVQMDILRLSAYQILFLDRVPDSAAVNEGVRLVRAIGMEGAAGFLNAVLRNLVRGKEEIPWPKREDDLRAYLNVMSSTPLWIVDRLIADYGEETAESLLFARDERHEMVVRPNLMQLDDAQFEKLLAGKAWTARRGLAPHAWLVSGTADVRLDDDYRRGALSVQGQSSMLAAEAVQAKPGMRILDACAAPGGKSCYMAEQMQGTGRVYAWELHEKRALLLESAKRRLHLENLRITVRDALELKSDFEGQMDAVLLDAPCSGLGVTREKPDLKYRVQESDLPAIVDTQRRLLDALCRYVRPGGALVYSTCSLLPEENADQVRAFLERHPDFTLEPLPLSYPQELRAQQTAYGLQLLNFRDDVESFFIARLRRSRA